MEKEFDTAILCKEMGGQDSEQFKRDLAAAAEITIDTAFYKRPRRAQGKARAGKL